MIYLIGILVAAMIAAAAAFADDAGAGGTLMGGGDGDGGGDGGKDGAGTDAGSGDSAGDGGGDSGAGAGNGDRGGADDGSDAGKGDGDGDQGGGDGKDGKDAKDGDAADKDKAGPPEKYELSLPEGSQLGKEHLEAFETKARELGLSQEQAEAVLTQQHEIVDGFVQQQTEQWGKQVEAWAEEIKADKEIGGEHLEANVAKARKFLDKHAPEGFKKELDESGYGNHPGLFKFILNLAKASSEDGVVGDNAKGGERSAAEILYGS